jgi:hypothetical protein
MFGMMQLRLKRQVKNQDNQDKEEKKRCLIKEVSVLDEAIKWSGDIDQKIKRLL